MPRSPVSFAIRDARASETDALTDLCLRSKAHWGYDAEFMAQCRSVLRVTPAKLRSWRVRVAETPGGGVVGLSGVSIDTSRVPGEAELEWLFVEPSAMRNGIGRALMDDVRSALSAQGVRVLWILADPGAERFYRSLGAACIGRRPSDAIPGRTLPWLRLAVEGGAPELHTRRLRLRDWRDEDLEPLVEMNADERVAEHLPSTLRRDESLALAVRIRAAFARHGFGLWAVERTDDGRRPFIGFIGLSIPTFEAHFTPAVEIAWRLAPQHWGLGLATEGARAVVEHAFSVLHLDELVSFTVPHNRASLRVMEKLGMVRDRRGDFDHPALAAGHRLRRHVLYRLVRSPSAPAEDRASRG